MHSTGRFQLQILAALTGLALTMLTNGTTHAAGTPPTETSTTSENGWEIRGFSKSLRPEKDRTFRPEAARLGGRSFAETQKPQIPTFSQLRSFSVDKSLEPRTYSSTPFESLQNIQGLKPFPVGSSNRSLEKPFRTNPVTENGKTFDGFRFSEAAKQIPLASAPQASRPYLGEEAERMKQKYTPENGPRGGVTQGHRLSVEELREILNRSK